MDVILTSAPGLFTEIAGAIRPALAPARVKRADAQNAVAEGRATDNRRARAILMTNPGCLKQFPASGGALIRLNRMPPPLPPSVEALLAHERVLVRPPYAVRARALARAEQALGAAGSGTLPFSAPKPSRGPGLFVTVGGGGLLAVGTMVAFQAGRQAAIAIGAPRAPIAQSAPSASPPPPTSPPDFQPMPAGEPRAVPVRFVGGARPAGVRDELQLLSRARDFDARGDYGQVLELAAEHERNHPSGRMVEEREALRVKALVGVGQADEARRVGANFRRRFPRSVLLSRVDELLASADRPGQLSQRDPR